MDGHQHLAVDRGLGEVVKATQVLIQRVRIIHVDLLAKGLGHRVHGLGGEDDEVVDVHADDDAVVIAQLADVHGWLAVDGLELKSDDLGLESAMPEISGVRVTVEGLHQTADRVLEE